MCVYVCLCETVEGTGYRQGAGGVVALRQSQQDPEKLTHVGHVLFCVLNVCVCVCICIVCVYT